MTRVLLNYIYYPRVGHTVEALRYAQGLYEGNPGAEIHVALHGGMHHVLAKGCPWIARTYAIPMSGQVDPVETDEVSGLPRTWDYIVDDETILLELAGAKGIVHTGGRAALSGEEQAMWRYCQWAATALTATSGRGTLSAEGLPDGMRYQPHTRVTISIPVQSRSFAQRYRHDGPKICVLLGGSGTSKSDGGGIEPTAYANRLYPDPSSWIRILDAIAHELPTARFYLIGARGTVGKIPRTGGYSDAAIAEIAASHPNIVDCYDIGLWNDLALLASCDVFISPTSGFSWLAPCVGTPALTIAGGDWHDHFFNDVPFYSVLPDNPDYPYAGALHFDENITKIPCMRPENLAKKVPEIVEATRLLLRADFTYADAVARHNENIARANVRREHIPTPGSPDLAFF